jgi:hypothetical protein
MNGKTSSVFQRLLAATLLVSGLSALAAPAFADGTAAGTSIDNTATATYDNPSDPNTPLNATSNTVKITVAEVAGVTLTPLSTIDKNGGTVLPGDIVDYEFKLTNVGNDTTEFFIPGTPVATGPGNATAVQITGYIKPDGTRVNFTTANIVPVPGTGANTSTLTTLPALDGNPVGVIPAGYSLIVNVPTTIQNLAASGADVKVLLGNTGLNDNSDDTQNKPNNTPTATDKVRTVDYTSEGGASLGPVSPEKEASAFQLVKVGSTSQALATILKTRPAVGGYSPGPSASLADDVIGYNLALKIESAAPVGSTGVTPGKLVGTEKINVDNGDVTRILVSDAIPSFTKLTTAADVTAPAGWEKVYTTSDVATVPANKALWKTTFDATATRIGFVYNATAVGAELTEGTTVTGFGFKVVTSGIAPASTTPVNIANIAQVFGQTKGNEGPDAPLVYDESGDSVPSNFNDDGTPSTTTATLKANSPSGNVPTGQADPSNHGVDNKGDNSGAGPGGEDNVITIAPLGTILNGTLGVPGAVGPTDNNNDFTNRSTPVPQGIVPGTAILPAVLPTKVSATFTNTIGNPSATTPLSNVLIVPDTAAFIAVAGEVLPPDGATVTLTYGASTAVYTFDKNLGNFTFTSGQAIIVPTLAPNQTIDYTVKVELLPGAPLSTDTGNGFSIPIYAFVDKNGDSRPATDGSEPSQNRTIDRVYTGFLQLRKDARILDKDGATVIQDWTADKTLLAGKGAKDRFIEYRISYKNISIAPTGTGNTTLDAKNVTVTEDGATGSNSWAKDNDTNGIIDTSHKIGSVSVTYGGLNSVIYSPSGEQSGTTAAADVTKYVHKPGVIIQPQDKGVFIFRRKIN